MEMRPATILDLGAPSTMAAMVGAKIRASPHLTRIVDMAGPAGLHHMALHLLANRVRTVIEHRPRCLENLVIRVRYCNFAISGCFGILI